MPNSTIRTLAQTGPDGRLNLSLDVGVSNTEVAVTLEIRPFQGQKDAWPEGYFETIPGSMPDLERATQGDYEVRRSFE